MSAGLGHRPAGSVAERVGKGHGIHGANGAAVQHAQPASRLQMNPAVSGWGGTTRQGSKQQEPTRCIRAKQRRQPRTSEDLKRMDLLGKTEF